MKQRTLVPDAGEVVLDQLAVEYNCRLVMVLRAAGLLPSVPTKIVAHSQPIQAAAERSAMHGRAKFDLLRFRVVNAE